jgi:tetratricopeptide (TPR) repeat protein
MTERKLMARIYARVDAFLKDEDGAAVTAPEALAEAAELEAHRRGGRTGPSPRALAAVGWLYWCRYGAAGDSPRIAELAEALGRFLPLRERHADLLPEPLRQALDRLDGAESEGPSLLFDLAGAFEHRFGRTGDRADIDRAVAAMADMVAGDDTDPVLVGLLGSNLTTRFSEAGRDPADLDGAERALARAFDVAPPGHPLRPTLWTWWVHLRSAAYVDRDSADRIDAFVEAMAAALAELDPAEPARQRIAQLADGIVNDLAEKVDSRDFERSARLWRLGAAATEPGSPAHGYALFQLGNALALRVGESAEPEVDDEAIEILRQAVDTTEGRLRALSSTALGNVYLQRFERHGDPADAAACVTHFRAALDTVPADEPVPPDDPVVPLCRTNLAVGLVVAVEAGLGNSELDEAIAILRTVTDAVAVQARARSQLGRALQLRAARAGAIADLHEAIEWHRSAVTAEPLDAYGHAEIVNNLGSALFERHLRLDATADLDEAIEVYRASIAGSGNDQPLRLRSLANLAAALTRRFDRTSDRADAEAALSVARAAASVPLPPGMAAEQLRALASVLFTLYEVSGSTADLEESIRLGRVLLDTVAEGDIRRPGLLAGLGTTLVSRHELTGAAADLEEALALYRNAVAASGPTHTVRAEYLLNLCNALDLRYQLAGELADLDEAVWTGEAAVDLVGDDQTRVSAQTNLAKALLSRYRARGDVADLDAAILADRAALEAAGPGSRRRVRYLSNLGAALLHRFGARERSADLNEAITWLEACVADTPEGDVRHATHLLNLGVAVHTRYRHTHADDDLGLGLRVLREAADSTASPVAGRLAAARSWGDLARDADDAAAAAAGYARAVELLPLLLWRGLTREDQERQLLNLVGLTSDAAAAALANGEDAHAVELLEQGRSLLWSQLLDLRTDLTTLRHARPDLADLLEEARAGLEETGPSGDDSSSSLTRDHRISMARQWDATVAEVRRLDGFADFLQPAPLADLQAVASRGPVIIVNVSGLRCDGLIVNTRGLRVVPLPELTAAEATRRADAFVAAVGRRPTGLADAVDRHTTIAETLDWLWRTTVRPLTADLGPVDRLWWCPTGALTRLPLHAAGAPDTVDSMLERAVSSYTPTLRALHLAQRAAPEANVEPRMLVVAMPSTPGATDLNVQPEIDALTALLPGRCTVRAAESATVGQVTTDMRDHSLAHFACHGRSDPRRPARSAFVLHDDALAVADIGRLRMPSAELAFLSACDTAAGGDLPDESLHLGAALHLTGYRQVIATLWPIDDAVAPDIAEMVYSTITTDGTVDLSRVPHALRSAMTRFRADGNEFLPAVWAAYIHLGP